MAGRLAASPCATPHPLLFILAAHGAIGEVLRTA